MPGRAAKVEPGTSCPNGPFSPSAGEAGGPAGQAERGARTAAHERSADRRIPDAVIAAAKAVPVDQVAQALGLKTYRRGRRLTARCLDCGDPEHDDKHPSLTLYPDSNEWHCFRCGRHGDSIALVEAVRKCDFPEALQWIGAQFGSAVGSLADPIPRWAHLRGVDVKSVVAFGVQVQDGRFLRFPMRLVPGGRITGWQKRRSDNRPFGEGGPRSMSEKDSHNALFLPDPWPVPAEKEVLLVCEGEADAIAAHSLGFAHVVGTPGRNWSDTVQAALEDLAKPFGSRFLIMDGDVEDPEVFAVADTIEAEVVRVPVWVSADPAKRDLNEWLQLAGKASVRTALKSAPRFTVLPDDAVENVLRAVGQTSGLQPRLRPILIAVFLHLVQRVLPFQSRKCKGVNVGPGEWLTSLPQLAEATGAGVQTVRTCLKKLQDAGILTCRGVGGSRGLLIKIVNPSEHIRLTRKSWQRRERDMLSQVLPEE